MPSVAPRHAVTPFSRGPSGRCAAAAADRRGNDRRGETGDVVKQQWLAGGGMLTDGHVPLSAIGGCAGGMGGRSENLGKRNVA